MGLAIDRAQLARWCQRWLGAAPVRILFEASHLSAVRGLALDDGREVVVKARLPSAPLVACVAAQRHLWAAGFPCPRPLVDPQPLGGLLATAEVYVGDGVQLPPTADRPRLFAEALARAIRLAPPPDALPTLLPAPAWVGWDHNLAGVWPAADDRDADLNAHVGPRWLDELGLNVRRCLLHADLPLVTGHCDWESQNLRWHERALHVVHDWDSVAARPEAAVAGVAAAVFTASGAALADATVAETAAFLDAYARVRGRPWQPEEWRVCWAAGLWVRAFNAKKSVVSGEARDTVARLAAEVDERLRLMEA